MIWSDRDPELISAWLLHTHSLSFSHTHTLSSSTYVSHTLTLTRNLDISLWVWYILWLLCRFYYSDYHLNFHSEDQWCKALRLIVIFCLCLSKKDYLPTYLPRHGTDKQSYSVTYLAKKTPSLRYSMFLTSTYIVMR